MSGPAANQRTVVATLRLSPPEGMDRWTAALVAKHSRLSGGQANEAIRSLRNAGKIKFGALELSPSMVVERVGEGEDPLAQASSDAIGIAIVSAMAANMLAFKALPPVPGADETFEMAPSIPTPPHPSAPVAPPPASGEGEDEQETATEPCAHPGDQQGEVAAAGDILFPPAEFPGHTDPAVRDTADEAGAPVVRAGVPASSLPAQPGNPLGVELLGEIEAYLAHTRMSGTMLGELALTHPGYVNLLRKRGTARDKTAVPMRTFMACWPDGATRDQVAAWRHDRAAFAAGAMGMRSVATAPGDAGAGWTTPSEVRQSELAEEVKAEALSAGERRYVARKFGGGVGNPLSTNVVAVQAVLLAEPEDAFLFLRRKWPKLLREVIAQARATGTTPASQLAHVIESGLIAAAGSL